MKELELYSTLKDLFKPTTHSHNVKKLEKKNKLLLSQTTTMKISAFALALAAAPAAFPGLSVAAFGPAPADRSSAASMIRSSTTNHRSSSSLFVATNSAPSTSTTVRPPIIVFNEDEGGNAMMEPSVTREASVEPLAIDDLPFGVKITGADKLRAEGLTGKGVRVAVIDSGVDAEHSGFHEQVKQQVWFRHGSSLSPLSEDFHELFHGTHAAGTIHMMAPEAEIYDYRCFGAEGVGVDTAIERSIYQAIDDGCDTINMSLGGPYASRRIMRAVRYAQ
jgi:subtilisin family serine protease